MAEVGHATKVRRVQGGDKLVIDGAGGGQVVPANETLPALVAAPAGGGTQDAEARAAIVSLIAILKNTGFMAQS